MDSSAPIDRYALTTWPPIPRATRSTEKKASGAAAALALSWINARAGSMAASKRWPNQLHNDRQGSRARPGRPREVSPRKLLRRRVEGAKTWHHRSPAPGAAGWPYDRPGDTKILPQIAPGKSVGFLGLSIRSRRPLDSSRVWRGCKNGSALGWRAMGIVARERLEKRLDATGPPTLKALAYMNKTRPRTRSDCTRRHADTRRR